MRSTGMRESADGSLSRRQVVGLGAASAGSLLLSGCCSLRPFASPGIAGEPPATLGTPLKPRILKSPGAPKVCIDTHAHFFNAADVPVKGYLEGPVAHHMPPVLQDLVKLLAPMADQLAEIAPTAAEEFKDLTDISFRSEIRAAENAITSLAGVTAARRDETSRRFYDVVQGSRFEAEYNRLKSAQRNKGLRALSGQLAENLGPDSLSRARQLGNRPSTSLAKAARANVVDEPFPDGLLAFIGNMLSHRWMNLVEYAQAYSSSEGAFGIDMTLGALVDFDRWLDCPPRSAQDDQVKLHQVLSQMSGGYMRPLVAYNPWSHIVEGESALERVRVAVERRGFVGVKIYPPNGFMVHDNSATATPSLPGRPSPADLNQALKRFWDLCRDLDVPVMAHTGATMGRDNAHDALPKPESWAALLTSYATGKSPIAAAAHFGGDEDTNNWTEQFSELMSRTEGANLYGDIGYWVNLRCPDPTAKVCVEATKRLGNALNKPGVRQRVMFGTDWLMLSQERDWAMYPYDIAGATQQFGFADDLFGGNALRCFGKALARSA